MVLIVLSTFSFGLDILTMAHNQKYTTAKVIQKLMVEGEESSVDSHLSSDGESLPDNEFPSDVSNWAPEIDKEFSSDRVWFKVAPDISQRNDLQILIQPKRIFYEHLVAALQLSIDCHIYQCVLTLTIFPQLH